MSFDFNVPFTRDAGIWANLLVETLKQSFSQISEQIANNNMRSELEDLKKTFTTSIDGIKITADDALHLAQSNATSIIDLRNEFTVKLSDVNDKCVKLEDENVALKSENVLMKQQLDDSEIYSRRKNLIIQGIPDVKNETDEQCEISVKDFLKNQLKLEIRDMKFVACHRIGTKHNDSSKMANRSIIVRFASLNDRKVVWSNRSLLRNTKFYMNENFPRNIGYNRRKLQPIYTYAKKIEHYEKQMSLKGDRLVIGKTTYTVNNMNTLPADIHPNKMCTVSNDKVLVSGGLLSEYSYLSNYYQCDLRYDSTDFPTLEHAYQHARAKHFNDKAVAAKILATKDPSHVKKLSYSVHGYTDMEWGKVRENLMLKLLRVKFARGTDLAAKLQSTGNKLLAESGKDKFFSCGLPLTHVDVLDSSKWKSNMLGKLQMQIRNELNEA